MLFVSFDYTLIYGEAGTFLAFPWTLGRHCKYENMHYAAPSLGNHNYMNT